MGERREESNNGMWRASQPTSPFFPGISGWQKPPCLPGAKFRAEPRGSSLRAPFHYSWAEKGPSSVSPFSSEPPLHVCVYLLTREAAAALDESSQRQRGLAFYSAAARKRSNQREAVSLTSAYVSGAVGPASL